MPPTLEWAWYALAATLGVAALACALVALFKDRARGRRRCPKCWYSMVGVPGTLCPECGRDAITEARLFKSRRSRNATRLAAVLCLCAYGAWRASMWHRGGWMELIPTTALVLIAPTTPSPPKPPLSPTFDDRCYDALEDRMKAGTFWLWQTQHYVNRRIAKKELNSSAWVSVPRVWYRSEPMPVRLHQDLGRPERLLAKDSWGNWLPTEITLAPGQAAPPVVPIRLTFEGHTIYENMVHTRVRLADRREDLLVPAPPATDEVIRLLIRPELRSADGHWYVHSRGERPPLAPGHEPFFIAFRVVLRSRGQVLAASQTYSCDSNVRFLNLTRVDLDWSQTVAPQSDDPTLTLSVESDADAALALWRLRANRFEQQAEQYWRGRIDWPAFPKGGTD